MIVHLVRERNPISDADSTHGSGISRRVSDDGRIFMIVFFLFFTLPQRGLPFKRRLAFYRDIGL